MWGFKKKMGEPGEADRLFRLMNINRVCHSVFCGRLEVRFPGELIFDTTYPGCGLAKPDKSRLFSCLTVHSRPPFLFTFCFLPPVNSGGTVGAVFCPVGFGDEHAAADRTAFQVPAPVNLRFQRPGKGQDRPPKPFTADRERNRLGAGAGIAIIKGDTIPVIITAALPADKGVCPFPLHRGHAVGCIVRSALQCRQMFIWVISHAFPPLVFSFAVLPERLPAPSLRRSSRRWHAPQLLDTLSRSRLLACFPRRGIPFGRSFSFQGAAHR